MRMPMSASRRETSAMRDSEVSSNLQPRMIELERAQEARHATDQPFAERDADDAGQARAARVTAHGREPVLHLLGERHQLVRAGVQLRAVVAAVDQGAAQRAFERLDAPRHGGRGDAQRLARREEAALAMNREQDAQVVPRRRGGLHGRAPR